MPFDVFISYSHTDKTVADTACAGLESAGIRCWIAPRDVRAGIEYAAGIMEGIDSARIMVLIFSSNSNTSPQVHREIECAVTKGLTIIPLRIEDTAPTEAMQYYLGAIHWLDALTPPLSEHVGQLVEQVKANLSVDPGSGAKPPAFDKPTPKLWSAGDEKKPGIGTLQWFGGNAALLALICVISALSVAVFLLWRSPTILITRTATFGGNGGVAFDDLEVNVGRTPVTAISVVVAANAEDTTQQVIGGLQVHWGGRSGPWRGTGPLAQPVPATEFAKNEKIGRVDVASGPYHFQTDDNVPPVWVSGLQIWTNVRVYVFGNMKFGRIDQCLLGSGDVLLGFYGRSGAAIDQIGCVIGKTK